MNRINQKQYFRVVVSFLAEGLLKAPRRLRFGIIINGGVRSRYFPVYRGWINELGGISDVVIIRTQAYVIMSLSADG